MSDLNFRMVTDRENNLIRVDFQKKIGWFGMTLREAAAFKQLLELHIDALQKLQHGGGDGRRDS